MKRRYLSHNFCFGVIAVHYRVCVYGEQNLKIQRVFEETHINMVSWIQNVQIDVSYRKNL